MEIYKHKIQYYETDKMQITHHSNYLKFMEEARMYFLDYYGYGYERMEKEGIISPIVGISCNYKKPTTYGDTITVETQTIGLSPAKLTIGYIMRNQNGEIVCTGESVHCFVSKQGKILSLKNIYPGLYNIFEQYLSEYNKGQVVASMVSTTDEKMKLNLAKQKI